MEQRRSKTRRATLLVRLSGAAVVFALIGAACGGGTDAGQEDAAAPATSTAPEPGQNAAAGAMASEGVDSGAVKLNQTLTAGLVEHEYLAGIAVAMGVQFGLESDAFTAAAGALDANTVDLGKSIGSIYGADAESAFLDSWRKHIGFFVDYTAGQTTGDEAKVAQARKNLDGYRRDFGELVEGATEGALPKEAVAGALEPHVKSTLAAIDAVAGVERANGFVLLKTAASHMPHIADALSGAISEQFPDEFDGDVSSGAADLQQALTARLVENEYLAGIAVMQALTNDGNVESPQFEAAAAALDQNSVDLSKAVGSIYGPEAEKAFLDSWRKHIGFFVDYTLGRATGDRAMVAKARRDLDGYRQDFGELLEGATEGILPAEAVADALVPHVESTMKAIDATVAFTSGRPKGDPFMLLKTAAAHMPHIATSISGAVVEQFPEKF
ncbi:MAG TPA: hypothetical protein VHN37_11740 [Actinomycetota bacterium]|nr:hypothetical protein [Actinomycetota bacterium]